MNNKKSEYRDMYRTNQSKLSEKGEQKRGKDGQCKPSQAKGTLGTNSSK